MKHDDIMKLAIVAMPDGTIQQVKVGADNQSYSCEEQVAFVDDIHPDYLNIMLAGPALYQMLVIEYDNLEHMQTICDAFGEIAQAQHNPEYYANIMRAKTAMAERRQIIAGVLELAREGLPTLTGGLNNANQTKH